MKLKLLFIFLISIFWLLISSSVFAVWQAPNDAFPDGNPAAPLDTSKTGQEKTGYLKIKDYYIDLQDANLNALRLGTGKAIQWINTSYLTEDTYNLKFYSPGPLLLNTQGVVISNNIPSDGAALTVSPKTKSGLDYDFESGIPVDFVNNGWSVKNSGSSCNGNSTKCIKGGENGVISLTKSLSKGDTISFRYSIDNDNTGLDFKVGSEIIESWNNTITPWIVYAYTIPSGPPNTSYTFSWAQTKSGTSAFLDDIKIFPAAVVTQSSFVGNAFIGSQINSAKICLGSDCRIAWPSGVSGSGMTGYIPKWYGSGGTTITNSVIYQSGNNVGIGTTTPTAKLTVVGGNIKLSGATTKIIFNDDTMMSSANGASLWAPTPSNENNISNTNTGNVGIGTTAPNQKFIVNSGKVGIGYNDATQGATLAINGNVGIGTMTPKAKLSVNYPNSNLQNDYTAEFISHPSNSGVGGILFSQGVTNAYKVHTLNTGGNNGSLNFSYIKQSDGSVINDNILTLQSGNVGIGTTNPGANLEVYGGNMRIRNGNFYFWSDYTSPPTISDTKNQYTATGGFSSGKYIFYKFSFLTKYGGETQSSAGQFSTNGCTTSGDFACSFKLIQVSDPLVKFIRIFRSNEIEGINPPPPENSNFLNTIDLDVDTSGLRSASFYIHDCKNKYYIKTLIDGDGGSATTNCSTTGSNSITVGSKHPRNVDTTTNGIYAQSSSFEDIPVLRIYKSGSDVRLGVFTNEPAQPLHVVGNSALMGNVGIGTTTPASALHIVGNITITSSTPTVRTGILQVNQSSVDGNFYAVYAP